MGNLLNTLIQVIFVLSSLVLMGACVIAANRMSGETGNWFKCAMILVIIGSAGQWMLGGYGLVPLWCMLPCIPISLGISAILILNRRRYESPVWGSR